MAIHVIRVKSKNKDAKRENIFFRIKIYRLEGITKKQAKVLAEELLSENINQTYSINESSKNNKGQIIEIAYKPGVMNPEVASIIKASSDLGIKLIATDSSWEYEFFGIKSRDEAIKLATKLNLWNKIVEHIVTAEPKTLLIKGIVGKTQMIPIRNMNDEELISLSKDKLFLNLEEMKIIQKFFLNLARDPKDIELETLAQTWSEHCAHKTFKARLFVDGKIKKPLIERLKAEALKHNKNILSAFVDNSGVMDFYEDLAICGKVETHNSPSAIEPYGGAATGSGGVFRDIAGTARGAKTIASTDIFCFANPDMTLSKLPAGCLPPKYLLQRVVKGVKDYGNRMGIPTNNGSVHFHDDFRAKPTIIVGAYGILSKKNSQKGNVNVGDIVIAVGGKTGRDGIHGATFSSAAMTDRTIDVNSSAVQIGNAIEEKRMFDALDEARSKNLIKAIQDCGAGGFSSAIGEIGEKTGVKVYLEKAPLKYQGMSPWEIWVSESQEKMIVAVSKENLKKFIDICNKFNTESTVLGYFDGSKKLKVYFKKDLICNLNMKFLHHGLPQRKMTATRPSKIHLRGDYSITSEERSRASSPARQAWETAGLFRGGPKNEKEWISVLKKVLSHGNVCSKEPIVRLYDHTVQGTNTLQPFSGESLDGPNDAVVLRPILDKPYGMVISHGLNPILNKVDPYWGSIWAGTEAISNYVAVGGDYKNASLINNYIWPFPDEESLWSLDKSVDAVCDFMKALKIPVISGKDSLSSTYRGKDGVVIKIPPVLCMSVFGKIPDVTKTVSSDFKKTDSIIILVGKLNPESMGGSTYFDVLKTPSMWPNGLIEGGHIPHVNLKLLPKVLDAIYKGVKTGKILSCHDISEGGLITAVFEMCGGGNMGATVSTSSRPDYFLFNEASGCFIVEVENATIAKRIFKNIPNKILGKTKKEKIITVSANKKKLFQADLGDLKKSWQAPMKRIFG